nr:hypothetical protein BaRGS_027893 [Batillaria attramentaria]
MKGRWFSIENSQLVYRKRSKDSLTIMEEDLRLCTIRPGVEVDRRFCFEVRSITLDTWEPELIKVMLELGNDVVNRCYEANREAWITAKYLKRAFVSKLPEVKLRNTSAVLSVSNTAVKDNDSGLGGSASDVLVFGTEVPALTSISKSEEGVEDAPTTSWEDMSKIGSNLLLYKAAERPGTIAVMLEALANGADPTRGSLAACEFLLLNGAKLDRKDRQGRTPLHHASILGNTGQVCQFLKRGAAKDVKDVDGKDPLTIAVEAANADIVTLLRLSKLNDEMRESDGYGNPGDDTFTDVFRDFSNMASNCPEKLKEEDRCLRLLTVDAV